VSASTANFAFLTIFGIDGNTSSLQGNSGSLQPFQHLWKIGGSSIDYNLAMSHMDRVLHSLVCSNVNCHAHKVNPTATLYAISENHRMAAGRG